MNTINTQPKYYAAYTDEYRKEMVLGYFQSGIGYKKYAKSHGLSKNSLFRWVQKYGEEIRNAMENETIPSITPSDDENMIQVPLSQYILLKEIEYKYVIIRSVLEK